jgi:prefoldin alpha subunit
MAYDKDLQEKILTYRVLEARLDSAIKQRELLLNKIFELENTLIGIEETEKSNSETLFSLGSDVFVTGKPTNKEKLIVGIGSNILLEKTYDDGIVIINNRKDEIEKELKAVQNEIAQLSSTIQTLTPEIQSMIDKSNQAG